jgi:hypothetical protein
MNNHKEALIDEATRLHTLIDAAVSPASLVKSSVQLLLDAPVPAIRWIGTNKGIDHDVCLYIVMHNIDEIGRSIGLLTNGMSQSQLVLAIDNHAHSIGTAPRILIDDPAIYLGLMIKYNAYTTCLAAALAGDDGCLSMPHEISNTLCTRTGRIIGGTDKESHHV